MSDRTVPRRINIRARLRRDIERSPEVNLRAISLALAGTMSYDELGEQEQVVVRERWAERATALRNELDYEARFNVSGESYSELDDAGEVAVCHPS